MENIFGGFQKVIDEFGPSWILEVDGKIYSVPLIDKIYFDFDSWRRYREMCTEENGWIEIPEEEHCKKWKIFVDGGYGIIKINLRFEEPDVIQANGAIFNPKKGRETLEKLKEILHHIADTEGLPVCYTTFRVNKSDHFERLLLSSGFEQNFDAPSLNNYEFTYIANPRKE